MTREEFIEDVAEAVFQATDRDAGIVYDAIYYGRKGLFEMSDQELLETAEAFGIEGGWE